MFLQVVFTFVFFSLLFLNFLYVLIFFNFLYNKTAQVTSDRVLRKSSCPVRAGEFGIKLYRPHALSAQAHPLGELCKASVSSAPRRWAQRFARNESVHLLLVFSLSLPRRGHSPAGLALVPQG